MNIFVAKLPYDITKEDLHDIFSEYGNVTSANVIMDRETGRSKGFGFVEMDDDDAARKAIEELNGGELEGRTIVVKEAEPRKKRDNFSGNNGGGNRRRW